MEETVSVLIWEDTMDMTDWARLLLAGSLETGVGGRTRRSGPAAVRGLGAELSRCTQAVRTPAAWPCPHQTGFRWKVFQGLAPLRFRAPNATSGMRDLLFPVIMLKKTLRQQDWE